MSSSSNKVELKFTEFYTKWMSQLEQLHLELLEAGANDNQNQQLQPLISKATAQFKEYYTVKWAAAHEDVLAFYSSPAWLTPLEHAHFWFTGWKPNTAFKLIDTLKQKPDGASSLTTLTEAQMKAIGELNMRIKMEEDKVESDMERQQVAVGDYKMVHLARMTSRVKAHQVDVAGEVDATSQVAVTSILARMEKILKAGDCVRLKAMKTILEVLTPQQSVEFLAALAKVHVMLRNEGLKMEMKNGSSSTAMNIN